MRVLVMHLPQRIANKLLRIDGACRPQMIKRLFRLIAQRHLLGEKRQGRLSRVELNWFDEDFPGLIDSNRYVVPFDVYHDVLGIGIFLFHFYDYAAFQSLLRE